MKESLVTPEFMPVVDREKCSECKRCITGCGWGALRWEGKVVADNAKCVACHYCVIHCPTGAIVIQEYPLAFKPHAHWPVYLRKYAWRQATSSGMLLTGMGNDLPYTSIFDHLV